jgi:hypothetical protein
VAGVAVDLVVAGVVRSTHHSRSGRLVVVSAGGMHGAGGRVGVVRHGVPQCVGFGVKDRQYLRAVDGFPFDQDGGEALQRAAVRLEQAGRPFFSLAQ